MIKNCCSILCKFITEEIWSNVDDPAVVVNTFIDFSNKLAKILYKSSNFP
jgi:hypothetical protein